MDKQVPQWLNALDEEDFQFLRRFLLASGSLKALAEEYGISYPTVRIRLDRLIEKVRLAEDPNTNDPFRQAVQLMVTRGSVKPDAARAILKAHYAALEEQQVGGGNHE